MPRYLELTHRADIAHRYGPMDLCLLPISTGSSLSFLRNLIGLSLHHYSLTSAQHSNAWDAIQIAKLMGARRTVAIHHSTFSPEDESRGCVVSVIVALQSVSIVLTLVCSTSL